MGNHSGKDLISIRLLKEEDADVVFKWRNSSTIIQLSSSQRVVSWEEHLNWIKSSINSPVRLVFIVEYNNISVGQIRFERENEESEKAIISIYLIDSFTGRGIGKRAFNLSLTQLIEYWQNIAYVLAWVRKENFEGQAFFQKQGFMLQKDIQDLKHFLYVLNLKEYPNMMNTIFYTNLVNKYGIDFRSLNWGSKQSQELRFRILSEIGDLNGATVLDVGCGLGDLYEWFNKNSIRINSYKGIDITPAMIEHAQKRFPDVDFEVRDIIKEPLNVRYDYVFASGIFYLVKNNPTDFMKRMITSLFTHSNIGIGFNSLSAWAEVKEPEEFYANPIEIIDFCRSLTEKIVFRHDYHQADFTIFLYKQ